ncbi:MAG: hypothetical protein WA924_08085 [Burkholderiaceae bacterium]
MRCAVQNRRQPGAWIRIVEKGPLGEEPGKGGGRHQEIDGKQKRASQGAAGCTALDHNALRLRRQRRHRNFDGGSVRWHRDNWILWEELRTSVFDANNDLYETDLRFVIGWGNDAAIVFERWFDSSEAAKGGRNPALIPIDSIAAKDCNTNGMTAPWSPQ